MSDQLLQRYLLDQVSDEERTRIEERFLADEDYYRHLLIVEDELRFAYAQGSMPASDRQRFEERFLIFDDERDQAALAAAMVSELKAQPVAHTKTWRMPAGFAMAAALLFAAGLAAWLALDGRRLRSDVAERTARGQQIEQQLRDERARREQVDRELQDERRARAALEQEVVRQREPSGASRGPILSLFLTPGLVRAGGETKTLTIPANTRDVRLMLSTEGQTAHRTYDVEIVNADGSTVWSRAGIPAGQQIVIVTVPTSAFAEDDYQLTLRGVTARGETERAGQYSFRVLK